MIATVLAAALAVTAGATPRAGGPHAPAEAALLRAAYPDHNPSSGLLGHHEGTLVERSSACLEDGPCILAVAATDAVPGGAPGEGHAWTTFFAFRAVDGAWVEQASAAGPVISAAGHWRVGVEVRADDDGALITVTTATQGGDEGDVSATTLWSWEGAKFMPVLTAATGTRGTTETVASYVRCADRPSDRPSWELRTREREGRGPWTDARVRVLWNGQAWVERPPERACGDRTSVAAITAAPAAVATAGGPALLAIKAASASHTAPAPRGRPQATAPSGAIDGNRQTAWVAGGKKGGVGEWLQLDFASPAALGALTLLGTCPGNDWKASPRLKRVRLRFENGPAQEELLADGPAVQTVRVRRTAPTRWVRVEVLELYRGARHQDACITEVTAQRR